MGHDRLGHNGCQLLGDKTNSAIACVAPTKGHPTEFADPVQRASDRLDVSLQAGVGIGGIVARRGNRSRHGDAAGKAVAGLVGRRVPECPCDIAGRHRRSAGHPTFRIDRDLEIGSGRDPAIDQRDGK